MSLEAELDELAGGVGYPTINHIVTGSALSKAGIPDAHDISGVGFLNSGVQAALTLGTGTAQLDFIANRPGTGGNAITVELETGGVEAVSVVGSVITVTLNTGTSTPDSIKATCDADNDFAALVSVVSGGAGTALVAAATPLVGGSGEDLVVTVAGLEQAVVDKVTDVLIPMAFSDDTGLVNTDTALCFVTCNGVKSNSVPVVIVT